MGADRSIDRPEWSNATVREKAVALSLARGAALRTFSGEARCDEDGDLV